MEKSIIKNYEILLKMKILSIGILIRLIVVYINIFIFEIPGLNDDARIFHDLGIDFSKKNYIEDFYYFNNHYYYSRFLGLIYLLFFESQFLGSVINIFFWFLSALFFYKILIHLNTDKSNINLALIFYSFFPTSILFSSSTFREPLILLGVNAIIYLGLKIYLNKKFIFFLLLQLCIVIICYLLAIYLHRAFEFISLILIFFILIPLIINFFPLRIIVFFLCFFVAMLIIFFDSNNLDFLSNLAEKAAYYRDSTAIGYSTYEVSISSNLALNSLFAFYQYMIQPINSESQNMVSFIVSIENILRLFIFIFFLFSIKFRNKKFKTYLICNFFSIIFIYFIWSQGTTNWGTSIRHSFPELGMLLLLFVGGLNKPFLKKIFKKFFFIFQKIKNKNP